jgi:hypothetical protein
VPDKMAAVDNINVKVAITVASQHTAIEMLRLLSVLILAVNTLQQHYY